VDFAGSKTIDEISVFGLHDNYTQENTPTETQTFTLYGLLAFNVQYWNGGSWITVPGGSVTGNNKVWRKFTFSPITTSKIRVYITAVPDAWSRVVEIQAFGISANDQKVQWLISDHLGTPRIVLDQTGSLANVKRHDYLPFGEELFAPTSGRSAAQGYSGGDAVRQQFTQKERDIETGLDYFDARYYSSSQGRFTSVDPFNIALDTQQAAEHNPERARTLFNAYLSQPQQWNCYSYAINNPLLYVDPTGESIQLSNDKDERERQMQALREKVGAEAGAYLYVNQGTNADGTANYYVGIYENGPNGNGPVFEQLNEVAGEIGAIIRDTQVVKLEFVGQGSVTDDSGDSRYIGPGASGSVSTPAVTGYFKGQLTIKMLDWSKQKLGYLPGSLMSDGEDNMLTPSVMQGHELGHARARMTGYRDKRGNRASREGSLRLENKIRKLQFPNGPTRIRH
jgi:RHS repeat-associated protein